MPIAVGTAWCVVTKLDICFYVSAWHRYSKGMKVSRLLRLDVLLKHLRAHACVGRPARQLRPRVGPGVEAEVLDVEGGDGLVPSVRARCGGWCALRLPKVAASGLEGRGE